MAYWCSAAWANRGDIFVSRNVSLRYKRCRKDENHALHWYEKAARLGSTEAQHQTAAMYAQGTGTKIDNKQAWMWLTIAGNNNPWIEKDALRCLMSEQDIQDAEQTAANCKRLLRI